MMKGPQAMGGYKANAEASKKAFDAEGFLNTGDLGRINPGTGHLIITGRAKVGCVCVGGQWSKSSYIYTYPRPPLPHHH